MMTKIKIIAWLVISVFLSGQSVSVAQKKPNIILLMADDLGFGDLGCYGQARIQTPHLDALAKAGIRFTQYYAGSTVCAPSREALLTGRHTGHTYIRGNFLTDKQEDPALPQHKTTLAERLKQAGYHTGLIGKWGLGGAGNGPDNQGFDYSYGYLDQIQAHNYYPPFLYENGKKILLEQNSDNRKGDYSHNLFFDKTVTFLNNTDPEKPFFLYLPYTIPHGKHVIPDNEPYASKDWPEQFKNYAAMITLLDRDMGRIMALLKEKGLDKNTLVLFTSDNGANRAFADFFKSNGPFRGYKTNLYEGGIREPLIACWPGKIKPGQVSDHVTAGWDLLPTLCEIADVPFPDSLDGISFCAALFGKNKQKEHPYLYWEYYTYNYNWNKPGSTRPRNWLDSQAARWGKWKAVLKSYPSGKPDTMELYNLEVDPGETNNIAGQYPNIIQEITEIMVASSVNDSPFFPYPQQ